MTPFRNPLTVAERAYNRLLTKERVLIEMMFGRLKKRFPILKNQVRLKTERIPNVIVACVVLYNIGIHLRDGIEDLEDGREDTGGDEEPEPEGAIDGNIRAQGQIRRRELADMITHMRL